MKGYPRRYIVYDTETRSRPDAREHGRKILEFRLGCLYYDTARVAPHLDPAWYNFTDTDDFHTLVCSLPCSSEPIYIFAHNHSFDARVVGFFRELGLGRYSLLPPDGVRRSRTTGEPLFAVDGRPFLLRLYRTDGQCLMLCDLGNWLDMSLAKIGDLVGMPKGQMPDESAQDHYWFAYCRNDVEVTVRALELIWEWCCDRGIKDWQPTIAAQALQSYRLRYARVKVKVPEDPRDQDLCRAAFYGGRVDCFRLGRIEGPIIQVDVNSMYPSLMRDGLFPYAIEEKMHEQREPTAGPPPHPCQTAAEVWLDTPENAYPVHTRDGTFYVRGRVRTILVGPELRRAVERGHVVSYGRYTRYRMSRLFTAFVTELWAVRMLCRSLGDHLGDRLCKVFMDSLFGKFGQRSGDWETLGRDYPANYYGGGPVVVPKGADPIDWRVIAGWHQRRLRDELSHHAFVAIPAFVTAYGRVFMDAVRFRLWEDGVYYQATDSLLIDQDNLVILAAAGLHDGAELGKFRMEGDWPWVDIRNVGWIERPGNPIRPGIPSHAEPHATGVLAWERWEGTWTGILRGRYSCASVKETWTRLRGTYTKQEVLASGRLRPWAISNWHLTPEEQRKEPLLRDWDRG